MRLLMNCGAATSRTAAVSTDPTTPPTIAGTSDPLLSVTALLVLLQLGLRHHGDVLGAKIVRSSGGNPAHGHFGTRQRELRIALEIVAFRGCQRCPRRIAFAVVDDAQLVPGKRVLIVDGDRCLQDS